MKIALISDLHIGIKKQCPVFMESQLRFFREQFVPELTEQGIKNIWVLGDVFDTRQQINTLVINKAIELFRDTLRDFDVDIIENEYVSFSPLSFSVRKVIVQFGRNVNGFFGL